MNKDRYRQWLREIDALRNAVPAGDFADILNMQLTDWLDRNYQRLSGMDSAELQAQLKQLYGPLWYQYQQDSVITNYQTVIQIANSLYTDMGGTLDRDIARIRRIEKVNDIQFGKYEKTELEAIKQTIRQGLQEDVSVKTLTNRLTKITGKRVKYHAKVLAQTQIKSYSRVSKAEKVLSAGVQWMWYVGAFRVDKIRDFCRFELERGRPRKVSEIRTLRNGNLEPVLYHCGGWRCVHDFEPDPLYKEK